jgi:hypothetical protein
MFPIQKFFSLSNLLILLNCPILTTDMNSLIQTNMLIHLILICAPYNIVTYIIGKLIAYQLILGYIYTYLFPLFVSSNSTNILQVIWQLNIYIFSNILDIIYHIWYYFVRDEIYNYIDNEPNCTTNMECSICLDTDINKPWCKYKKCGHLFHKECYTNWYAFNRCCPYCRAMVVVV